MHTILRRLPLSSARAAAVRPLAQSLHARMVHTTAPAGMSLGAGPEGEKLFDKILIANRGEIACRVMDTCKRLGIRTVAVYSEPDANAKHVRMADEAVCVGPAASSESYINMDAIMGAIEQTGAQAVHPGYGFLSENHLFAERLTNAGVAFIGPGTRAIRAMGDKIESKKIAEEAGVNTIPGHIGEVANVDEAIKIAEEIGYPVMLKASAGGGGKGLRIARDEAEAREGFQMAVEEAEASFGDGRMLVEKYIEEPRHIEIQVLADGDKGVYLAERECSVQRRNQKVLEEAPSVVLDEATRKGMGEQAVALAAAVNYKSAGTVEFLIDKHLNWYFLEMNTRLQVEHPVTEYVTGVDLVEQMIRVAAGHPLLLEQSDIKIRGHATEARVYAEDPMRNFLPSIGTLTQYREPLVDDPAVRCDSGIVEGSEISMHYDPMISKLIAYGETREESIETLRKAIDAYVIGGVGSNVSFLRDVLEDERYVAGRLTTDYIPEQYPDGFTGHVLTADERRNLIAGTAMMQFDLDTRAATTSQQVESADLPYGKEYVVTVEGEDAHVVVTEDRSVLIKGGDGAGGDDDATVVHVGEPESRVGDMLYDVTVDGEDVTLQCVQKLPLGFVMQHIGTQYKVLVRSPLEAELDAHMPEVVERDMSKLVVSPMPGAVVSLDIKEGDSVVAGQAVAVVEAMKMQNVIRAAADGVVKSVTVAQGDNVAVDETMIELE